MAEAGHKAEILLAGIGRKTTKHQEKHLVSLG